MSYDRPSYAAAAPLTRRRELFVALLVGLLTGLGPLGCLEPDESATPRRAHAEAEETEHFLVELASAAPDSAAAPRGLGQGLSPKFAGWRQEHYTRQKAEVLSRAGAAVVRDFPSLPMVLVSGTAAERAALEADPAVRALHEDGRLRRSSPNLAMVGAPAAQGAGADGAGTAIAIIDTGVDYTRAAFGSCTAPGVPQGCRVIHSVDVAPDDGMRDDGSLHGTNVSGVAAQLAPAADLLAFDVFDGEYARVSSVLGAINWLVLNGAAHGVVVANMSLGGDVGHTAPCATSVFAAAIAHLRQAGIVPVVASGNDAFSDAMTEPACAPAALSVGAVYPRPYNYAIYGDCADYHPPADQVACFSNGAHFLDMLAPGVQITAGGETQTGTSQAAPHVAGAVAAYATLAPAASADDVEAALKLHGVAVTDTRNGHVIPRLDLAAAVAAIPTPAPAPAPPPAPVPTADPCPLTSSIDLGLVGEQGGVGALTIEIPAGCPWSAAVDVDWIRLDATSDAVAGEGSAVVELVVFGNRGPQRQGHVGVGDDDHLIVQAEGEPLGEAWVVIDDDAPVTDSPDVTLHIHGQIHGHEPTSMCVSNTGSCQTWEPFATTKSWRVSDGAGEKRVSVWLMRGDGTLGAQAPLGAVLVSDRIQLRAAP